jgi:hypothetical protein
MKKLYFLNEEESTRILNLHKDATRKQYLKEDDTMMSSENELAEDGVMASMATGAAIGGAVGLVPGAIIGGAIGLINGLINGGNYSYKGAERILQACRNSKEVGKSTMSRATLNGIADNINAAVDGMGTDEDAIKSNLQKITTIPDLCAMSNTYKTRHGESLFAAIDGDIDSEGEWKQYVFLPLLDAYENSKELGEKAAAAAAVAPSGTTTGTTDTTKVVKRGGVSNLQPKTKTIQSTLGVSQTGTMDQATIDALMVKLQGSGQ